MEGFFKAKTPAEVFTILDRFGPLDSETLPLSEAFQRVLGRDLTAPEDLPDFPRSTVDGYAVRAGDTYGASESLPALLQVVGEVAMGAVSGPLVAEGQAVKIPTGGMLPEGADAVVMIEYCAQLDSETLEVGRPVSPLENLIRPGDDFRAGARLLPAGHRLRPQDLGCLAGLGLAQVPVRRRPRVGLVSTGDEIVPIETRPGPGQVRDVNRHTLHAFCRRAQAEPRFLGCCPDRFQALKALVDQGLEETDTLWVSGGSSVGTKDLTLQVFESLPGFELLVHGISISPGKPTIIGRLGHRALIGLPGHVASALVVAEVFLARLLARLSGATAPPAGFPRQLEAVLTRNLESPSGREDFVRVKLRQEADTWLAEPVFGKSGLISTLVESDGLLRIELHTEGLYQGQKVRVLLFE